MADTSKYGRLFRGKLSTVPLLMVILLATVAVYSQLAGHGFVTLDDSRYVTENSRVLSGLSPDNIAWAFQTMEAEFWHPLTWLSYMLDTDIYGPGPGGYLLTNLLLHLLNCVLIFTCFRRCPGRAWEAWLIAAVFALHPLHVEPVAWVSGRKEILCACFWLSAILAYYEYASSPGWRRYFPVAIFFALGMMAKPMIVTLPFVLLLLDYWPLCRDGGPDPAALGRKSRFRRWLSLVTEKIPLFGISAVGIAVTLIAQQRGDGLVSTDVLPLSSRMIQVVTAYAVYLKKSIWPGFLTPLYPPPAVITNGVLTASVLVLLAVTAIVCWRARHQRYLFVGWFWFLGTLVPVIGMVKVGDFFIADRYMYMPLAGILIMMAFGIKALIDRLPHRLPWLIVTPVLIAGVYAPATRSQVQTWKDSETLYTHALLAVRDNFLAHHALGHVLASRQDRTGAIEHFSKATAIRPDKAVLWVALGRALAFDDQWQKAEEAFARAARLEPEHPAVWFYLGCARAARGKMPEALNLLLQSLEKKRQQGRYLDSVYEKAMDFYEKGLYYAAEERLSQAGLSYTQALAVMDVDVSRRRLTRLVVDGYEQWLTGQAALERGAD